MMAASSSKPQLLFINLPYNLQQEIVKHADRTSAIQLLRVSRHFRTLASQKLYGTLFFSMTSIARTNKSKCSTRFVEALQTLTTSDYDYARHVKVFEVALLCPDSKQHQKALATKYHIDDDANGFLNTLLSSFLKKAVSLDTFFWWVPIELSASVYRTLGTIESLTTVTLSLDTQLVTKMATPPSLTAAPTNAAAPSAAWASSAHLQPAQPLTLQVQTPGDRSATTTSSQPSSPPRQISAFAKLTNIEFLGIDSLDCAAEMAKCIASSSSTLRSLILSLSEHLIRQANKPSEAPQPSSQPQDVDMDDDIDPDFPFTGSNEPTSAQTTTVSAAESKKLRNDASFFLAKLFGLDNSTNGDKRVDKELEKRSKAALSKVDQEIKLLSQWKAASLQSQQMVQAADSSSTQAQSSSQIDRVWMFKLLDKAVDSYIQLRKKSGVKADQKPKSHSPKKDKKNTVANHSHWTSFPPNPSGASSASAYPSYGFYDATTGYVIPAPDYLQSADGKSLQEKMAKLGSKYGLTGPQVLAQISADPSAFLSNVQPQAGSSSQAFPATIPPWPLMGNSGFEKDEDSPSEILEDALDFLDSMKGEGQAPPPAIKKAAEQVSKGDSWESTPIPSDDGYEDEQQHGKSGPGTLSNTPPEPNKDDDFEFDNDMEHPDTLSDSEGEDCGYSGDVGGIDGPPNDEVNGKPVVEIEKKYLSQPASKTPATKLRDVEELSDKRITPTKSMPKPDSKAISWNMSSEASVSSRCGSDQVKAASDLRKIEGSSLPNDKEEALEPDETMQSYLLKKHGFAIEELTLYLTPVKASVLGRALDLSRLRTLSLLSVGPQGAFWTLLSKYIQEGQQLQLRSIQTDDVSQAFLGCVEQLPMIHNLHLLKRLRSDFDSTTKKAPATLEEIRTTVLRKHARHLIRFSIVNNDHPATWQLDQKSLKLLASLGENLQELACFIDYENFHPFLRLLPRFKSLIALNLVRVPSAFGPSSTASPNLHATSNMISSRDARKAILNTMDLCSTIKLKALCIAGLCHSLRIRSAKKPKAKPKSAPNNGKGKAKAVDVGEDGEEMGYSDIENENTASVQLVGYPNMRDLEDKYHIFRAMVRLGRV